MADGVPRFGVGGHLAAAPGESPPLGSASSTSARPMPRLPLLRTARSILGPAPHGTLLFRSPSHPDYHGSRTQALAERRPGERSDGHEKTQAAQEDSQAATSIEVAPG